MIKVATPYKWKKYLAIYIILTFLIFLFFAELGYKYIEETRYKENQKMLLELSHQYAQSIQEEIVRKIHVLDTLESMVKIIDYKVDSFYKWAPTIYNSSSDIYAVQLAPDGIVSYTYPYEENKGAIGHNLLKDIKRDDGAYKAIIDNKITFVGPVKLIQNGQQALICRKPVFRDKSGEFWGFVIVLIGIDDLHITSIINTESNKIEYQIVGDDPDSINNPLIIQSKSLNEWQTKSEIKVPNGKWLLQLSSTKDKKQPLIKISLYLIFITIASVLSLQHYQVYKKSMEITNLNTKLNEISYKDELTSAYNRRGIFSKIESLIKDHNQAFCIGFIDIDDFKSINDSLGHDAGDEALIKVVEVLQKSFSHNELIGRIGGDEFVFIARNSTLKDAYQKALLYADSVKETPFIYQNNTISLTLSVGIAEYKKGDTIHTLYKRADERVYKAKSSGKDQIIYS